MVYFMLILSVARDWRSQDQVLLDKQSFIKQMSDKNIIFMA